MFSGHITRYVAGTVRCRKLHVSHVPFCNQCCFDAGMREVGVAGDVDVRFFAGLRLNFVFSGDVMNDNYHVKLSRYQEVRHHEERKVRCE